MFHSCSFLLSYFISSASTSCERKQPKSNPSLQCHGKCWHKTRLSYIFHNDCIWVSRWLSGLFASSWGCVPRRRSWVTFSYTLCTSQVKEKRLEMKNRSPAPAYHVDGKSGTSFFVNKIFSRQRKKKKKQIATFSSKSTGTRCVIQHSGSPEIPNRFRVFINASLKTEISTVAETLSLPKDSTVAI